ncbi:MAG: efflux RND transporter periplasmic adaptor subunit [Planctomycetota bacterium]
MSSSMPGMPRGVVIVAMVVTAILIAGCKPAKPDLAAGSKPADKDAPAQEQTDAPAAPQIVEFPVASWEAAKIKTAPVEAGELSQSLELTGKVTINEERVAHIFPLIDGRVDEVKIRLGDNVKQGDPLVVVQSIEVGKAMLQLYQDRLERDFVITKDEWTQTVAKNTQQMIKLMRANASIEEIERQLTDHPMGEYRDKLISAFVASYKARKTLERFKPLTDTGAITGKQLLDAESEGNATRATLQSLMEQYQQETQQSSRMSTQLVKEMQTRVAVDETNLKVLGFNDEQLKGIDPLTQGEAIAHYPITAPFDGTIISKDVVLMERVGPTSQILSVADLTTVWVTTDVYEEHLPLLNQLENREIEFHTPAWPKETFQAQVFYTGDLVQESSRTVSMRALAKNQDGKLRPGMFVTVRLPSLSRPNVVRVPRSAVLDYLGKHFVFVHLEGDKFERRDVVLGASNEEFLEIKTGLKPGDKIAVSGGFALKTSMLSEFLVGE